MKKTFVDSESENIYRFVYFLLLLETFYFILVVCFSLPSSSFLIFSAFQSQIFSTFFYLHLSTFPSSLPLSFFLFKIPSCLSADLFFQIDRWAYLRKKMNSVKGSKNLRQIWACKLLFTGVLILTKWECSKCSTIIKSFPIRRKCLIIKSS